MFTVQFPIDSRIPRPVNLYINK